VRNSLAQTVLAEVTSEHDLERLTDLLSRLQVLSRTKYDEYGGYMPGVKFIESLATWLNCFDMSDRPAALQFVLRRLVLVSAAEMEHLVSTVYQDVLRPWFRSMAAKQLGYPLWQVARIAASDEFKAVQRRTLVLGMSDGARLDRLRRASDMSTEQFHLDYVIDPDKAEEMRVTLEEALSKQSLDAEATFKSVLVVDDFSGSGATMLRPDGSGGWKGKVPKILHQIDVLQDLGVVANDVQVTGLLYLMTEQAERAVRNRLKDAGYADQFQLKAAYTFPEDFPLDDERDGAFLELCDKYFRPTWVTDATKVGGDDLRYGFSGSALPLVLHHNAPNNAPPILWKDDETDPERPTTTEPWTGVFPRHERHHPGRP
jgi:hypothetical protein